MVCPPSVAPWIPIEPSPGSIAGESYKSASKHSIQNMGQEPIPARNNGVKFDGTWEIAELSKPLGAVIEMVKKGNRVVFDETESGVNMRSIYNKKTGRFIPINKVGRGYSFDM